MNSLGSLTPLLDPLAALQRLLSRFNDRGIISEGLQLAY